MSATEQTVVRQRPLTRVLEAGRALASTRVSASTTTTVGTSTSGLPRRRLFPTPLDASKATAVKPRRTLLSTAISSTAFLETGQMSTRIKFDVAGDIIERPYYQVMNSKLITMILSDMGFNPDAVADSSNNIIPIPQQYARAFTGSYINDHTYHTGAITGIPETTKMSNTTNTTSSPVMSLFLALSEPLEKDKNVVDFLVKCFELANWLEDQPYFQKLISVLFNFWDDLSAEFMKVKVSQDLSEKIMVNLPFILLPASYRSNKRFIMNWLYNNGLNEDGDTFTPKLTVLNCRDRYYNNDVRTCSSNFGASIRTINCSDSPSIPFPFLISFKAKGLLNGVHVNPSDPNSFATYIYDPTGDFPLRNVTFAGKKVGLWRTYCNAYLEESTKGHYVDGLKEGEWERYTYGGYFIGNELYKSGQLQQSTHYKILTSAPVVVSSTVVPSTEGTTTAATKLTRDDVAKITRATALTSSRTTYVSQVEEVREDFYNGGQLNTLTTYYHFHVVESLQLHSADATRVNRLKQLFRRNYTGWLPHGRFEKMSAVDDSGVSHQRFVGNYYEGRKHGKWCEYYGSTGVLKRVNMYVAGKIEGPYSEYYQNGDLYLTGHFHNRKKTGIWWCYHQGGLPQKREIYDNGQLVDSSVEPSILQTRQR